jgi:hypothetical protein
MLREESDVKKKHGSVHKEKNMNLYFSLPASRKNFFYNLHEGFFFKLCTHGYKPKCTVPYKRKGAKNQVYLSHRYTTLLSILRLSSFPPVSQGGNLHKLVNGSSLKCT